MEARLTFELENAIDAYTMRLFYASGDTLVFADEQLEFQQFGYTEPKSISLGAGHRETRIGEEADKGNQVAGVFRKLLRNCRVYHFHDTSPTANIQRYTYIGDNRWLMPDAGNLVAFLYKLRNTNNGAVYQRILSTIRLIAPFFDDFILEPTGPGKKDIILNWSEKHSDQVFGPHQLSDGTLRALCLVTLLLQPEDELPDLIIIDEPELGLHPYALNLIAALMKKASHHAQIIISTQSSAFLDNFDPESVIVVNRSGNETQFTRLKSEKLTAWLDEYNLEEIWEKNVIDGGPH